MELPSPLLVLALMHDCILDAGGVGAGVRGGPLAWFDTGDLIHDARQLLQEVS